MEMRQLGKTGLVVSRLGLGLAALGRPGYMNLGHAEDLEHNYAVGAMQTHTAAVLDVAWQAGVRYFDAARSYGRAEEFLAHWLADRHIAPESITIGSKWGYIYTAGWQADAEKHEIKSHTLDNLTRQLAESQDLLGDQLDLYQIHSATLESGVLDNGPVLEALARLRQSGVRIGLSVSGPRQAETILRALHVRIGGEQLFDCVQATWNVLERSARVALALAHLRGVGVIIKEGLANGRLTERNTDPNFAARRRVLEKLAHARSVTADAVALACVLAQPWADVVLSGAATAEQLTSNLAALSITWDPDLEWRLATFTERPEDYWQTRSKLPWS
jgi:aryl-alcohol dehydrogenase-like predicted oxidoreductase